MMEEIRAIAHVKLIGPKEAFEQARSQFSFSYDNLDIHYIKGTGLGDYEYGKIQGNCGAGCL